MSLTYPLTSPAASVAVKIAIRARTVVGQSVSPFTFEAQSYVHQGQRWMADVQLPPMVRADAEVWIGFLLALNGRQGTFLLGDPVNTSPLGTWAGSPKVNGAHVAGVTSIAMDGFSVGATVKAGDWFQIGTGSSAHLHKVVQDATADGSGLATLEIFPRTRAALSDNATFVTSSPVGLWRLDSNDAEWLLEGALLYGMSFSCEEAL